MHRSPVWGSAASLRPEPEEQMKNQYRNQSLESDEEHMERNVLIGQ